MELPIALWIYCLYSLKQLIYAGHTVYVTNYEAVPGCWRNRGISAEK